MKIPTNKAIGKLVRAQRAKAGLRQADLGAALGITFQSIAKFEKGISALTVVQLCKIAKACKCKPADLIPEG